jgi:arylsulfatase A-like enzyme
VALLVVVVRGLAKEIHDVQSARFLERGQLPLAMESLVEGFWSGLPARLGVALAALAVIAALALAVRRLVRPWPGLPRAASWGLRGAALLSLALPALLQVALWARPLWQPPPRWNVVLIVVDTLRADHLGIYGYDRGTSPRLDALARDSFVFERAISAAPWTRTSLATLFSSQEPAGHGVYSEWRKDRLAPGVPTMQRMMRNLGLRAEAIVTQPHYRFGLDEDYDGFTLLGNGRAGMIYDRAIGFLDRYGDEPFFLVVHNLDPHDGYEYREGFSERPESSTLRSTIDLSPAQVSGNGILFDSPGHVPKPLAPDQLAELIDNYDGEIRYLDHHVGRFLDALAARGLADDTIVVVTADHGEEFFDHGDWWHGSSMHDELLHVPLIVHVPGMGSGRIGDTVGLVDVWPTLADLVGAEPPPSARGRSLVPRMRGEALAPRPVVSASGFRRHLVQQSVLLEPYKLIRGEDGRFLGLYDLAADPGERTDLGPDHPARARLEAWLPEPRLPARKRDRRALGLEDEPAAGTDGEREAGVGGEREAGVAGEREAPEIDGETRAMLRALGYASDPPADAPDGTDPSD